MPASLPSIAGFCSTAIFAGSTLPMVVKAVRTRDLGSYSLGNLVLANLGNGVHTIYVLSLPAGPVWALHAFNASVAATMLWWFLRYEWGQPPHEHRRATRDRDLVEQRAPDLPRSGRPQGGSRSGAGRDARGVRGRSRPGPART